MKAPIVRQLSCKIRWMPWAEALQTKLMPQDGSRWACEQDMLDIWEFPKIRGTFFLGVLIIRILLFRVLY